MTKLKVDLLSVSKWDVLPDVWKVVNDIQKLDFKYSLTDKGLLSIFEPFFLLDPLREALGGLYVDDEVLVATDAHKFFCMPKKANLKNGLYLISPKVSKSFSKPLGSNLDDTYPNYKSLFRNDVKKIVDIDVLKLKTYCEAVIKGQYCHPKTYGIKFLIGSKSKESETIGFNAENLIIICDAFLKLGSKNIFGGFLGTSSMMYFSDKKEAIENPKEALGKYNLAIALPIEWSIDFQLGSQNYDYGTEIYCYYSFEDDEIHNKDGSIADFDRNIDKKVELPYMSNDELKMLKKVIKNNAVIPITECVLIKDSKAYSTNFGDGEVVIINNINVEDGVYDLISGALKNTTYNLGDFPTIYKPYYTSLGKFNGAELYSYVKDAKNFVGDDEYREILMGISYISDFGEFNIYASDATILYSHKITESTVKKINKSLLSPDLQAFMLEFMSGEVELLNNDNQYKFATDKYEFIVKAVDTKPPNFEVVIEKKTNKVLSIDKMALLNAIKEIKGKDAKMNITLQFPNKEVGEGTLSVLLSKFENKYYEFVRTLAKNVDYSITSTENELYGNSIAKVMPIFIEDADGVKKDEVIAFSFKNLKTILSVEQSEIANLLYKDSGSSGYNIILSDYNEIIITLQRKRLKKSLK